MECFGIRSYGFFSKRRFSLAFESLKKEFLKHISISHTLLLDMSKRLIKDASYLLSKL